MSVAATTDLCSDGRVETDRTLGLLLGEESRYFDEFPGNGQVGIVLEWLQLELAAFADDELRVCLYEVLLKGIIIQHQGRLLPWSALVV